MSTSRRNLLLADATAAPGTAAAAPTLATSHPDAALIQACAEFDTLERRYIAAHTGGDRPADALLDAITDAQKPFLDVICVTRATTLAGHRARAASLALWDTELLKSGPGDTGEVLTSALVRDLIGAPETRPVPPNPDAELIALCQRFAAEQLTAWYLYRLTEDDTADEKASDFDTARLIAGTPATTPEGWQAKALAQVAWERTIYDAADDEGPATVLLSSMLRDMVRPTLDAMLAQLAAEYGPLPVEPNPEPAVAGGAA